MKASEMRGLGRQELESKLVELKKELMKISAQASVSVPKSPGKIKHMKKTIARIITMMSNKSTKPSGKKEASK